MKYLVLILFITNLCWSKDYTYSDLEGTALKANPLIIQKTLELKELKSQINKIQSDYYPEVKVIVGQENRIAPDETEIEKHKNVAELRVNYNLYQFGASKKQLKALEENKKVLIKNIDFTKKQIKRDLKRLFYSTLSLKKELKLADEEIRYNKTLKKQVSNKKKQGLVGAADTLEIDMREATLKNRQIKITEEYQHGLDLIRKITLIPHEQVISLQGDIPHSHFEINLKELHLAAKSKNIELAKVNSDINSLSYQADASFSKRLPSLKLMGRYGNMRIDETYTSQDTQEGLVGLYLEIPLFDGGRKSSEQAIQESRLERSKQKLRKTKHDIEIDLAHKFEKFQNIHTLLDLSEKNLENAKRYFKNVLSEYKRGVKNSLDLVSARDRLYQFHIDVIKYKKEYQLTKLDLERISGLNL